MMRRAILKIILVTSFICRAQDATFTLIDHDPLSINPAYALPGNGQIQFLALSRQQWWNLPGPTAVSAAYNMNQATMLYPVFSKPDNGLGFGVKLNSNSSGEGNLQETDASLFAATRIGGKINRKRFDIGAGISTGLKQYRIDWSQLTFSSQLDPFYGLVNSFPIINPREETSSLAINSNVGLKFSYTTPWVRRSTLSIKGGAAIHNWNKPGISFFDQPEKIPQRYTTHFSAVIMPLHPKGLIGNVSNSYFILRHNMHYQFPQKTNELRVGTNLSGVMVLYTGLRRKEFFVLNETIDAVLMSVQVNTPKFILSIGYDYTVSELNIQRTRGTTEIGLTVPLGVKGNLKGRRASEPCYVDYLLKHAEWKAVEKFNNKSTDWGREYSPITFIL
jgi:type IX secretion system PorP/SprF family membrane protein